MIGCLERRQQKRFETYNRRLTGHSDQFPNAASRIRGRRTLAFRSTSGPWRSACMDLLDKDVLPDGPDVMDNR
jgi:hypothetical protein